MRQLFLISVVANVLLIGCVETKPQVAKPTKGKPPTKVVQPSENFAEQYFRDYASLAAEAALETAKKCEAGEFRDVTAADDHFNEQTKLARLKANEPFSAAMTSALNDSAGKKASEVAPVYRKVADGFGKIAK